MVTVFDRYIVFNVTESFPPGLYLKVDEKPEKGSLVIFCPEKSPIQDETLERGYVWSGACPSGTIPLLKQIMAVSGDRVRIAEDGVFVNGVMLPNSTRKVRFVNDIPLPWEKELSEGEVLFMSPHPRSFDGRYFGPLSSSLIVSAITPFWVRGN